MAYVLDDISRVNNCRCGSHGSSGRTEMKYETRLMIAVWFAAAVLAAAGWVGVWIVWRTM